METDTAVVEPPRGYKTLTAFKTTKEIQPVQSLPSILGRPRPDLQCILYQGYCQAHNALH